MAGRTERVEDHQVHSHITQVDSLLSEVEALDESKTGDALDELSRLTQVQTYLKRKLQSIDPNLLPLQTLDNIDAYLGSQVSELTAYRDTDRTLQRLINANTQCDHILIQISNVPAVVDTSDVEGIRSAVTSFRKSVGQYTHNIDHDYADAKKKIATIAKQLATLVEDINRRRGLIQPFLNFSSNFHSQRRPDSNSSIKLRKPVRMTTQLRAKSEKHRLVS